MSQLLLSSYMQIPHHSNINWWSWENYSIFLIFIYSGFKPTSFQKALRLPENFKTRYTIKIIVEIQMFMWEREQTALLSFYPNKTRNGFQLKRGLEEKALKVVTKWSSYIITFIKAFKSLNRLFILDGEE